VKSDAVIRREKLIATETIFGIPVSVLILLVQALTLIAIFRYVYDTYRSTSAHTYFQVVKDLNNENNILATKELKNLIKKDDLYSKDLDEWNPRAIELARTITNRYQIVAHMVERNFLNKAIFFENFSGTMMDVWNTCAYFIHHRRQAFNNTLYLRRDLERLALQAWLYQLSIGYETSIKLINNNHIQDCYAKDKYKVKRRIEMIKREAFIFLEQKWK